MSSPAQPEGPHPHTFQNRPGSKALCQNFLQRRNGRLCAFSRHNDRSNPIGKGRRFTQIFPLGKFDGCRRREGISRRGRIEGMEDIGGGKMVKAYVPLSEMFGYSTDLRSKTQGRGNYSMFFEKYEQVPKSVQEKVLAAKTK